MPVLPQLSAKHQVMVAAVADPRVDQLAAGRADAAQVYDAAAAERARNDRRAIASRLRRQRRRGGRRAARGPRARAGRPLPGDEGHRPALALLARTSIPARFGARRGSVHARARRSPSARRRGRRRGHRSRRPARPCGRSGRRRPGTPPRPARRSPIADERRQRRRRDQRLDQTRHQQHHRPARPPPRPPPAPARPAPGRAAGPRARSPTSPAACPTAAGEEHRRQLQQSVRGEQPEEDVALAGVRTSARRSRRGWPRSGTARTGSGCRAGSRTRCTARPPTSCSPTPAARTTRPGSRCSRRRSRG